MEIVPLEDAPEDDNDNPNDNQPEEDGAGLVEPWHIALGLYLGFHNAQGVAAQDGVSHTERVVDKELAVAVLSVPPINEDCVGSLTNVDAVVYKDRVQTL